MNSSHIGHFLNRPIRIRAVFRRFRRHLHPARDLRQRGLGRPLHGDARRGALPAALLLHRRHRLLLPHGLRLSQEGEERARLGQQVAAVDT